MAADHLVSKGMEIVGRQYRNQYGEIDLICRDGQEVVFVEVKARQSVELAYPEDSVTMRKIEHLVHTAEAYLEEAKLGEVPWRLDVVAIEYDADPPVVTHIEDIDIPERLW